MVSRLNRALTALRGFRLIWLAPLLAIFALGSWTLASPIGAGPDDDYHLVSIWCADDGNELCTTGSQPDSRQVPLALAEAECFANDPGISAACQLPFTNERTLDTKRGNFVGAYPPVFYGFMSIFAGENLVAAALLMRLITVFIFVGVTTALFALLPERWRPTLIWSWLISMVPLGLFLLSVNNPSSWTLIGTGSAWFALVGWYETHGKRKWALGALFILSVLMAAGSRADGAVFVVVGIGAAIILVFKPTLSFLRQSILPIAMTAVSTISVLTSRQTGSAVNGFSSRMVNEPTIDPTAPVDVIADPTFQETITRIFLNLLDLPSLWSGVFGSWGLGWLDTTLPAIVLYCGVGVFLSVSFVGASQFNLRKGIIVAGAILGLCAVPLYVLAQGGNTVGEQIQPRYIQPLIVLLAGFLMVSVGHRIIRLSPIQRFLVSGALIVAGAISLHANIRRYTTGNGIYGLNLDTRIDWWWNFGLSPMSIFVLGALAWAGLVVILVRRADGEWLGATDNAVSDPRPRRGSADSTAVYNGANTR